MTETKKLVDIVKEGFEKTDVTVGESLIVYKKGNLHVLYDRKDDREVSRYLVGVHGKVHPLK